MNQVAKKNDSIEPSDIKARIRSEIPAINEGFMKYNKKMEEPYPTNSVRQALQTIQDNKKMTEIRNLDEFDSFSDMYNRLILRSNTRVQTKPVASKQSSTTVTEKECPLYKTSDHTLNECRNRLK